MPKDKPDINVEWNKSEILARRLAGKPGFEIRTIDGKSVDFYRNRRLIYHDGPINGGVYMGQGLREAIVVDDSQQPKLTEVYRLFVATRSSDPTKFKVKILSSLSDFVRKVMPPDEDLADRVLEENNAHYNDKEVPLEQFINKNGVCRHLALLGGYILERLIKEGLLGGRVSVDRNYVPRVGGHAWIRYTTFIGEVVILDPTQGFNAYLSDIITKKARPFWTYLRPEDN